MGEYGCVEEVKGEYEGGGLGDMKVKGLVKNMMEERLEGIGKGGKELEKDIGGM